MFNYNLNSEKQKIYEDLIKTIGKQVQKTLDEDVVISSNMRDNIINLNDQLVVELKNRLSAGEVKFSFRKANDRLRRARGTCHYDTIKLENPDFEEWDSDYTPVVLSNPYVVHFYDLDKKAWRSCDVDRLLIIIEK